MKSAPASAFHFDDGRCAHIENATQTGQKYRSNVLAQKFVGDADFRAWFTQSFARWLQINFANPEAVAAAFGVRYQTALNWWNASNRATGDTVALAFMNFPSAIAWFLAEWDDAA